VDDPVGTKLKKSDDVSGTPDSPSRHRSTALPGADQWPGVDQVYYYRRIVTMWAIRFCLLLTLPCLAGGWVFAQVSEGEADRVCGVWLTEEGKAQVEIYRCGEQYCGKIIWLREPMKDGKPVCDDKNPDVELQTRPVMGMILMEGFTYDEDGEYTGGTIYDAESGDTYTAKMELVNGNTLDLRGYILIPLLGRTTTWVRVTPGQSAPSIGDQKR
jgi:uncharacterized protein (DUF2147 family)